MPLAHLTPPHPAGVLSDALRAAVRIWVGIWVGVGCWEIFVFETVKTFSILGIASIANENHDGASEKFVCFFVGFTHTHPARFCSASGFVSICVASWKIVGLLSANALMRPLSLLGAGRVCPVPAGRCAEPFWVRDFSGLGSWSPAKKIIVGDQTSF